MSDMVYPAAGSIYLLAELNQRNANISDLIDNCVAKDRKIAEQAKRIAELEAELANRSPDPKPQAAVSVTNGSAKPAGAGERA